MFDYFENTMPTTAKVWKLCQDIIETIQACILISFKKNLQYLPFIKHLFTLNCWRYIKFSSKLKLKCTMMSKTGGKLWRFNKIKIKQSTFMGPDCLKGTIKQKIKYVYKKYPTFCVNLVPLRALPPKKKAQKTIFF